MPPPTGRVLPVSDSHDPPSCPTGKSSLKMIMMMMVSAKLWWNDARHSQCSTFTLI